MTSQVAARERETQAWTKAQVSDMTHRLQLAEDFPGLAMRYRQACSENFDLLFGALYLGDKGHITALRGLAHFATEVATEPREYALGQGLVGQAAEERRTLKIVASADKPLKIATGVWGTVEPACVFFLPVIQSRALSSQLAELATAVPVSERTADAARMRFLPTVALNTTIAGPAGRARNRKHCWSTRRRRRQSWPLPRMQPKPPPRLSRFLVQHEPRDPHADERDHRHVAPRAARPS